jgi:ABC-type uncharacterized transport system permease subunit
LIYILFSSSLFGTWGVVRVWWCQIGAIPMLRRFGTRRRPMCTCVSCFNYRICILLIFFSIHFPWCHSGYSASNERNNPRFRVRTEELCPSHAIEVNVNFITITEVLPRIWFGTSRVLVFDDSMLIYILFCSSLVWTWGVVGVWWGKTGAIPVLRRYRTRRRLMCTCVSCFNYRKCILLTIFYSDFPWCHSGYSASNGRNNPRFGVCTEELCPSHVIEVNVNFITITEVLPRIWFRTAQVLHFDDLMLIYILFSSSLFGTWGVVRVWWCQIGAIPMLRRFGTRRRPMCTSVSCFNYRICILLIIFLFTSHGVTDVILHPTKEIALHSGFARRSYAHPTR